MEFVADILLIAGALSATLYCIVLSRRLRKFNDLETGVGSAIAQFSGRVEEMTKTLAVAQEVAANSKDTLEQVTQRAENVAGRLELLLAAMHDLPEENDEKHFAHSPEAKKQTVDESDDVQPRESETSAFRSARSTTAWMAA